MYRIQALIPRCEFSGRIPDKRRTRPESRQIEIRIKFIQLPLNIRITLNFQQPQLDYCRILSEDRVV